MDRQYTSARPTLRVSARPKRLPRKCKKWIIKTWGREVYKGVMEGKICIYHVPKAFLPHQMSKEEIAEAMGDFKSKRGLDSRYTMKPVEPDKLYQTIKISGDTVIP